MKALFQNYTFFLQEETVTFYKPAIQRSDLIKIIEKAGGSVTKFLQKNDKLIINILIQTLEDSQITNSKKGNKKELKQNLYSHRWILDSISNHTILNMQDYKL